jgi:hypothetical protein
MLALIRPDGWNLPLFLHVFGAIVVVGATATLAIAGFASRRNAEHNPLLARTIARAFILGVLPSWILMRVAAEWVHSKEFPSGAEQPGWIGVGYIVSDGTAVLLIVTGILAGLSVRRGRVLLAVPILATICVLGYAFAWFAMSGKP